MRDIVITDLIVINDRHSNGNILAQGGMGAKTLSMQGALHRLGSHAEVFRGLKTHQFKRSKL